MTAPPPNTPPKYLPTSTDLSLIAVGFSGGQHRPGVESAPSALISHGLLTQLSDDLELTLHHDSQIHTYADLIPASDPPTLNMLNPRSVSAATQRLCAQVHEQALLGRRVLTLGGDHSLAIGSIAGVASALRTRHPTAPPLSVIWVDAHADINRPADSASGNIHGMPLSFLSGLTDTKDYPEDIFGWMRDEHKIELSKLVYIGLRDVDRAERRILKEHNVRAFSMHDVDKHGIGRVMEMALQHVGEGNPIHLSFDVDALDPMWAPSTGTPVRGGLTLREGDYIAECVAETGCLVGMDLVEVNPSIEVSEADRTIRAGTSIVRCALGDQLL